MNDVNPSENITADELKAYNSFGLDLIRSIQPRTSDVLPRTLWHYTSGDTFIRIIESGALWSTQIACLNDHTEFGYAINLLRSAIRDLRTRLSDNEAIRLCELLDERLGTADTHSTGYFVACMSAEDDDLSQWRAYGGGEGGFAIGLDPAPLFKASAEGQGFLVQVLYDLSHQNSLIARIAEATVRFYCEGLRRRPGVDREKWLTCFLTTWEVVVSPFAVMLKHPKFSGEKEWRFVRTLQAEDVNNLQFLQRRTLMSRHLPLRFPSEREPGLLPITHVKVGPCRYKQISRISAGDLLLKKGYDVDGILFEESEAPFQIT
ncbi:hypothetical protein AA309_11135 [Microvirga vignae]|uniref:DUF2971 domain-containing protein n=1 Tax=Microvirga vignae TaxID=1225564 RepID=A0A0H1RDE9_9HYPH|nr:DUF2971 domain-containing protein [Microvirga vignae]KLK93104.1 hypothetical protein AA309_11135 [Microvirga vignae]